MKGDFDETGAPPPGGWASRAELDEIRRALAALHGDAGGVSPIASSEAASVGGEDGWFFDGAKDLSPKTAKRLESATDE